MLPPGPADWPFRQDDDPFRRQDTAPATLRHDISLAQYLERQRACRATPPMLDPIGGMRRLLVLAVSALAALFRQRARRSASPLRP